MSEYKYEVDTQSKIVDATREAKRERELEIAKNLKTLGYPAEDITRATGLSPDEIAGL
jgi:hypothetical protein